MRMILKAKEDINPEEAKSLILSFGVKIIERGKRLFLVEHPEDRDYSKEFLASGMFLSAAPEVVMHRCVTVNLCGMDDNDVDGMSEEEAKQKLKNIRDTALWWASQEDDDRCWLDDIKALQSILPHGSVNFSMPDDLTFLESCIRFKRSRCPKNLKIHEW